jgi:putative ABC transport system permease protein
MLRVALKGLVARKLRLLMTALSVALGVAFVAGTFIFSDTLNSNFDSVFSEANQGVDVEVSPHPAFTSDFSSPKPLPPSVLARVRRVPGVKAAIGETDGIATMIAKDGEPIQPQGPPTLGDAWVDNEELSPFELVAGSPPRSASDVAIDAVTARKHGFRLGDPIDVVFLKTGVRRHFRVSGIVKFGSVGNLAGATLALFEPQTAQRLLMNGKGYSSVDALAEDGVSAEALRRRIDEALPGAYKVDTGEKAAQGRADQLKHTLGFLSTALLVFAGISLFVGSFLIFNTFSITVAQRTRELALLRAVGARAAQVTWSVAFEALLIGVAASAAGVGLGVLVALGIRALMTGFGFDLPASGLVFHTRTPVAAVATGVVVTLVAALLPARRAGRVPPVAAMREAFLPPAGSSRRRTVAGVTLTGAGAVLLVTGLFGSFDARLQLVGGGALAVFLGVAMLAPLVVRPLAALLGTPIARARGVAGKLARDNAERNPGRTAATAAALMIGLALVCFAAVFAASLKKSVDATFAQTFKADFVLQSPSGQIPFPAQVAKLIRRQPAVGQVAAFKVGQWRDEEGKVHFLTTSQPTALAQVADIGVRHGNLSALKDGGVFLSKNAAKSSGVSVGDMLIMEFPDTGRETVRVDGIYADTRLVGDYLLSPADFRRNFRAAPDFSVIVKRAPGGSAKEARAQIESVLEDYPTVQVEDQAGFREHQRSQVNQLLGLIYALLALTIVVALFGIANTLGLSILERIREIGLLRAVGAQRGQVRAMIRWEAAIVALMGAVLGVIVGTLYGWAMVSALKSSGVTEFAVPYGQLAIYTVLAGVAGIVAAVPAARRAARLDVLEAVTVE